MEQEKIFAYQISYKGLISKIYNEIIQLNSKNKQTYKQKQTKKREVTQFKIGQRHFVKGDIQMAKKYIKRCATSLIIREMQVKITVRDHLTPVRMAIIKKTRNRKWC